MAPVMESSPSTRSTPRTRRRVAPATIILVGIVLVGATARYWALGFGLPHTEARPDEARILNLAVRIANGDLNPHYFVYPTLYMYLVAGLLRLQAFAAGLGLGDITRLPRTQFFVTGRCLTAALGSATILAVWAIGKRLRDTLTGLFAAGLLALSFLHVRDSHFATTDVPMVFGVMLSVLLLVASNGSWQSLVVAGIVSGLATSLKYNAALLVTVGLFLEAHSAIVRREPWRAGLYRSALFGLSMLGGFLVGTPFAIVDRQTFMAGIRFVGEHLSSGHVHDGQVLAVSNAPWVYASFMLPAAVGWPIFVTGIAGLALLAWQKPRLGIAFVLFPAIYFVTASRGMTVLARYMLPVIPFLCIGAAYAVRLAVEPFRDRRLMAGVGTAAVVGLLLPSAIPVVRLDALLARPDNRLIVAKWIGEHVGAGRSMWQSGSVYGRVQYFSTSTPVAWTYDEEAGVFMNEGGARGRLPDYILIQRSPLILYSRVPDAINKLLSSSYLLIQSFNTGLASLVQDDYDPADAFFVPLVRLKAVRRPGPEFDLYELREVDRTADH